MPSQRRDTVELNGSYTFDAPREVIWQALMDPEVLAKILPGVERLEKVSDTEFTGVMDVRVGPVQGKFNGKVVLSDLQEPEKFHMDVDGRGAAGFIRGGGDALLEEVDGKTVLTYSGDAQVGGRIASVGQRLVETTAKSIVRQGLESLDRLTQAQLHPPEAGAEAPPVEYAPPSEIEVALGVARDVLDEYIPPEKRPAAMAIGGALVALLIALIAALLLKGDDS
ncbi:MAG TPA: carbon monoxide dehydrogenase [Anaerolineae bacterium]|nr:carbon monoxide dehydrogenase [Anaerolineae bacterium]